MANRNKGRPKRSRKRRRSAAPAAGQPAGALSADGVSDGDGARESASGGRSRSAGKSRTSARDAARASSSGKGTGFRDPQSLGERPQAPWHPLPLAELLILVGAIGTVVGLNRGISHGGPPLFAGLAAVVVGTTEVTLREHLSGYRSHTLILALLPTIAFHTAVVLIVAAFTRTPRALNILLLVLDAGIFALLFKLLRARFQDARRERVFAGAR